GELAALGPIVAPAQASLSLRWARSALALARDGALAASAGPLRVEDHLATVILLQDREMAGELALALRVRASLGYSTTGGG
ncbi:MAG: hypothetical protein M3010_01865, partial [Candidatus Dormibacteraeota bacterium]|nr:hypothetical protein [Candidatus Dormibacteraeota bacterium]